MCPIWSKPSPLFFLQFMALMGVSGPYDKSEIITRYDQGNLNVPKRLPVL